MSEENIQAMKSAIQTLNQQQLVSLHQKISRKLFQN